MRAVDTNVLFRWIVGDDSKQTATALALVEEGFYLPLTVLMELEWVLRSVARMERSAIAGAMAVIVATETISMDNEAAILWAVDRYRRGADWADLIHLISASGATSFATFDRRLSRQAGPNSPVAIEMIR